jgi:heme-degrading monooxygenase HmoA
MKKQSWSVVVVVVVVAAVVSGCEIAQPFEGQGFTLGEGLTSDAPGPFTVSTTLLIVGDNDGDQAAFDGHMEKITEELKTQEGLIGKSLSVGVGVDGYRTLTAWESEEAMFGWVTNPAHVDAMVDMADKTKEAIAVSWTMTRDELEAGPPSWDDAKARLDADGRRAY